MAIELRENFHGLKPNPSPDFIELCEFALQAYSNKKLLPELFAKYLSFAEQQGENATKIEIGSIGISLYYREEESQEICFFSMDILEDPCFTYCDSIKNNLTNGN